MSQHHFIDGYNVIHQVQEWIPYSLQEQRRKLVRLIDLRRPFGSHRNQVTVVFDGSVDYASYTSEQTPTVKIIFAQQETADERIKKLIAQQRIKKNATVVTNDRALQYSIRALGAHTMGVSTFLNKLFAKRPAGRKPAGQDGLQKSISHKTAVKINDELRKFWLDK